MATFFWWKLISGKHENAEFISDLIIWLQNSSKRLESKGGLHGEIDGASFALLILAGWLFLGPPSWFSVFSGREKERGMNGCFLKPRKYSRVGFRHSRTSLRLVINKVFGFQSASFKTREARFGKEDSERKIRKGKLGKQDLKIVSKPTFLEEDRSRCRAFYRSKRRELETRSNQLL